MGPHQLGWLAAAISALAPFHASGPDQIDGEGCSTAILGLITGHWERFPALIAAIGDGAVGPSSGEGYEFGLELILDGIASRVGGAG